MARNRFPLIAAGVVMGAGLGGFVDGIVLHQILQWHNMLSAQIPPNDLVAAKINMFWDGVFHAGVWLLTVLGIYILWFAGKQRDVPWSGRTYVGSLLVGWGLFNLIEGGINHHYLGLHHVYEYAENKFAFDAAFLGFGVLLIIIGILFIRTGRYDLSARGRY
jgi:uncharacterized membrane protein